MLQEIDTEKTYIVTSGVLSYSVPFPLYEKTDVAVVWSVESGSETTLTLEYDYSVEIADDGKSGTVTLVEGRVPVGSTLALQSSIPETQELDLSHTSDVDTESLETELDRQVQMIQQLHDEVRRAVKVPVTSSTTPEEFQEQLFTARDEAQSAMSAAQTAQSATESCRDEACECAAEAAATLESAVTVIQQQEQLSVEVVQSEGDTQAQRLEDIAKTILISASAYNRTVSVQLTSPITNGDTYTLPDSLAYLVGKSQLFISANGEWLYNNYQYEELGTDGTASSQVQFLQDFSVDDVITFTILANTVNLITSTNSGLVNDSDGYLKVNIDGQTVLINTNGQIYVPVMKGASASAIGSAGLVPQPSAGDQDKVLKGDGTWSYLSGMPIGTIFWSASATPVDGALVCNGATPLIATYPDLYAVIGTRYGGDGVTTFGVPNMIDRVAWGATTPGTYLEAGLPNITGTTSSSYRSNFGLPTGAFYISDSKDSVGDAGDYGDYYQICMDLSRANAIYGNSDTVQPPALTLVPYIKAYDTVQNVGSMDASQLSSEINRLDGKFEDYLPTSGGTMEGSIIMSKDNTYYGSFFTYTASGEQEIGIEADTTGTAEDGGILVLYTKTSGFNPGGFSLSARDGNGNNRKSLRGYIDGTLTWNGSRIVDGSSIFIANQSTQIYLPAGGTWNVAYFNWGTDNGFANVGTYAGGAAIPMSLNRTAVFAIRIS